MEQDNKLQLAKNNAYRLLRERPRSEAEMRSRLKMKGYGGDIIEAVIVSLKKLGEIDDKKFAFLWVDSHMHLNPVGNIVLRRELKEKGISEDIISAALEKKLEEHDEFQIAFDMVNERYKRLTDIDRKKALKRLYDHLLRRGFEFDLVRRVIDKVMNENR